MENKTTYIVYLDESEDNWYDLYYVGISEQRSKKTFKKEVPTFLSFVPEDSTKLKLVQVDLGSKEFNLLRNNLNEGDFNSSVSILLKDLRKDDSHEEIFCEPGYKGFIEFVCDSYNCDYDEANILLDNDLVLQSKLIGDYLETVY
jgi:hypothetical protein